MTFATRAHPDQRTTFREAVFSGLAPDGGLYRPVDTPALGSLISSFDDATSFPDLSAAVAAELLPPDVEAAKAARLARRSLDFPLVLRRLDERVLLLELFHGPTCAFKDFGARFLAAAMEEFLGDEKRSIQILVATSGDTGSAVAHAFHGRAGIDVAILYPSGRVTELQEKQLTTLGGNVRALEVAGSFDDCQRMVKEAFQDRELRRRLSLCSANSINVGRLLPQALYYIYSGTRRTQLGGASPTFCVPSGNFGNLTAGIYAWRWGLPVKGFLAATNANDVVPAYLSTGRFSPRASTQTLSNAMDVGNPSNFERLLEQFDVDHELMARHVHGAAVSDQQTLETMRHVFQEHHLHIDPHTAVGYAAAKALLERDGGSAPLIVLSTAHPAKFAQTVRTATGSEPEMPERLARCLALPKQAQRIPAETAALSEYLLGAFGSSGSRAATGVSAGRVPAAGAASPRCRGCPGRAARPCRSGMPRSSPLHPRSLTTRPRDRAPAGAGRAAMRRSGPCGTAAKSSARAASCGSGPGTPRS
jgi:threonine synthase